MRSLRPEGVSSGWKMLMYITQLSPHEVIYSPPLAGVSIHIVQCGEDLAAFI